MKATITAFVDVGFFKLHIDKTQLIPDATIARTISTCVSNMKAENIENWFFNIKLFLFINEVIKNTVLPSSFSYFYDSVQ